MEQIRIGTCVPGQHALEYLPHMVDKGYETFELCFHMEFYGQDITQLAPRVMDLIAPTGQKITALGLYCNPLQYEEHKRNLKTCIDNVHLLGTDLVCTFAGALEGRSAEEAMPVYKQVFTELGQYAADRGVRLAFENCPMGGVWERETCNISHSPRAWDMMFNEVPLDNIGLEWEPAHALKQLIDPLPQLRKYAHKVFSVHGKDTTVDWDGIRHEGMFSGKNFVPDRFPGFGDTNWRDVFYILHLAGYTGDVVIEGYHDNCYNHDWEMTGQMHALNYLKWSRGGDYTPSPWVK